MWLTFRAKLVAIAGTAALAQLLLLLTGIVVANRVQHQLDDLQRRYVPKVELEPRLEGTFERLWHGFQDAVGAHDADALAATRQVKVAFLSELDAAHGALAPSAETDLRAAFEDYDTTAYDVSHRLIANETGEALLESIAAMQSKQARVAESIKEATALNRDELPAAFAATTRAANEANVYRLWVSAACLILVISLSIWLGRGVLRALDDLKAGFHRFGRGDFSEPIRVVGRDEIADVARRANEMAASLARLGEEHRQAEEALKLSNRELEAFSYSVAHDLRTPLRGINGFGRALLEDYAEPLDDKAKEYIERICAGASRMGKLIDSLLALARVSRVDIQREPVDLSQVADAVMGQLRASQPERAVEFRNGGPIVVAGDPSLLRAVLENLLGNAWKFTGGRATARIELGVQKKDGETVCFVRDNGAGFDMAFADAKLFMPFQRLHRAGEFPGSGIGLATVQRIVRRHGGRIWAESTVDQGATFYFTFASVSTS